MSNKTSSKNLKYKIVGYTRSEVGERHNHLWQTPPDNCFISKTKLELYLQQARKNKKRTVYIKQLNSHCHALAFDDYSAWDCVNGWTSPATKSVNEQQIGGDHYKSKSIQPWDFIIANNLGFCEGNAIKYICRWKEKNGIEDLQKAKHYIDKLIEAQNQ